MRAMLQAPFTLHRQMLAELARVAAAAAAGRPARVVVKINALTDAALIEALVGAARAGADIDLIVRGACMLRARRGRRDRADPGALDRRPLPRALAHRLLPLGRRASDDEALYLSSADWMGRNMYGRIEVAWPVRDARLRQRVIDECLVPYLHDGEDAWTLARRRQLQSRRRRRAVGAARR